MAIEREQSFAYQGQSLDEICLLEMTRDIGSFGYFSGKEGEVMTINFPDQKFAKYKLLRFNEFTSQRKCVSVIVKRIEDDRFFAYVKGADTSLIKMANPEVHVSDQLKKDVENFSNLGLRTMVFGFKELFIDSEQKKFLREVFEDDYDIAEFKERQITEIESDLTLLGATGLEDLLQENVKRCIEDFRAADIKVWMLTGDKGLTAMQIGKSCGLIPNNSTVATDDQDSANKESKVVEIKELGLSQKVVNGEVQWSRDSEDIMRKHLSQCIERSEACTKY